MSLMCIDKAHAVGYSCARCNCTYCLTCDQPSDVDQIKTLVRYCQDWRCQREKKIAEGQLLVASAKTGVTSDVKTKSLSSPRFLLFVGSRSNGLMHGADCYLQTFATLEDAVREADNFAEHAFGEDWKQHNNWKREDVWWNVLEIADKTAAIVHFGFKQGD